jgi:D-alanine transaminase
MPIVYHNGRFIESSQAIRSIEDRGLLFADGVYEVVRYDNGRPFAMRPHIDRLKRSLGGIELPGIDCEAFGPWSDELMVRNGLKDARVYWQVTRGDTGPRSFYIPEHIEPSITLIAYPAPPVDRKAFPTSGGAISADDCRWTRCWIKSTMLLPASLAKTKAKSAGAIECIFVRHKPGLDAHHVTEGGSTNAFIVRDGELHTHPNDGWVLPGITREVLIDAAHASLGMPVREVCFTLEELKQADEVFVCSTTQLSPITSIDGHTIADGNPGAITTKLHFAYLDRIFDQQ